MALFDSQFILDDVRIRPLELRDGDAVFRYLTTDPTISQWTRIPWPYTRDHLNGFLSQVDQHHSGSSDVVAAVVVGDSDELVGCCGIHRIGARWQSGSSFIPNELGYWLGAEQRGRGVMRRAASLLVQLGLTKLALDCVNVQTHVGNASSQHVIRSIGFRFTETVLGADVVDDDTDHDRFVMTATDWELAHGPLVAPRRFVP